MGIWKLVLGLGADFLQRGFETYIHRSRILFQNNLIALYANWVAEQVIYPYHPVVQESNPRLQGSVLGPCDESEIVHTLDY